MDFLGKRLPACLFGALLIGCAGGGSSATRVAGAIPAAGQAAPQLPAGAVRRPESAQQCSGTGFDSFVGGGESNTAEASISGVLEGESNDVCDYGSSIGNGFQNLISSGASTAYYSFIGAGTQNTITGNGQNSLVGSGSNNILSGADAAIAGGDSNDVSNSYGFIGAGRQNVASGEGSVVGGGYGNAAKGSWSTIPGGYESSATGIGSFAAGVRSNAATAGAFVWSDDASSATQLSATAANQFLARASGGFTLWTNATNSVGAKLAAGSGTWASASDRNMKTDIARIDDAAVLDKVAMLPIERWSYTSERGVRHLGPMAQDFYAAFGVGEDDKHITSIDEDGVALAAIKALHARVRSLDAENVQLRARLAAVKTSQSLSTQQQARRDASMQRELERLSTEVSSLRER
jgi:hypothetical protein